MTVSMVSYQKTFHHEQSRGATHFCFGGRSAGWKQPASASYFASASPGWSHPSSTQARLTVALHGIRLASVVHTAYQKLLQLQCAEGVRFPTQWSEKLCRMALQLFVTYAHPSCCACCVSWVCCADVVERPAGIFRDNILRSIVGYNNLCAPWRAAKPRQQLHFTLSVMPRQD